jgi:hypothetical protein
MIALTSGAVVNILLDPLLIFGLLGFPGGAWPGPRRPRSSGSGWAPGWGSS